MAEKEFKTRVQQLRDTSANWTAKNPVLKDGELIVVTTAAGDIRFKVGDGTKHYQELPFTDEKVYVSITQGRPGVYSASLPSNTWGAGREQIVQIPDFSTSDLITVQLAATASETARAACANGKINLTVRNIANSTSGELVFTLNGITPSVSLDFTLIVEKTDGQGGGVVNNLPWSVIVPSYTAADEGKVLTIAANGSLTWAFPDGISYRPFSSI